jgi:hypothetical protein
MKNEKRTRSFHRLFPKKEKKLLSGLSAVADKLRQADISGGSADFR